MFAVPLAERPRRDAEGGVGVWNTLNVPQAPPAVADVAVEGLRADAAGVACEGDGVFVEVAAAPRCVPTAGGSGACCGLDARPALVVILGVVGGVHELIVSEGGVFFLVAVLDDAAVDRGRPRLDDMRGSVGGREAVDDMGERVETVVVGLLGSGFVVRDW